MLERNKFQPHSFGCESEHVPFPTPIGLIGNIATFDADCDRTSIELDLAFLESLRLGYCYYGAVADSVVYPFISNLNTSSNSLLAAHVLDSLHSQFFDSDHINDLQRSDIVFPGYHPGTRNDEIHTTFREQCIFPHDTENSATGISEWAGTHGQLKGYVVDNRLWYILLHTKPFDHWDGLPICDRVFLFAVGKSPHGNRLMGVVTTQACHNLCD